MDLDRLAQALRRVHWRLVKHLRAPLATEPMADLAAEAGETAGDVIYVLDRRVEEVLLAALEAELGGLGRFDVIAEGLGGGERATVPAAAGGTASGTLIIDPIDGTRGLMYGKRSGWVLTGFVPASDAARPPVLEDIELAVQTEIPTARSPLADQLWAVRGRGVRAVTRHLDTGVETAMAARPSAARSIRGGFANLVRYFPPDREVVARLDDALIERVLGPAPRRAQVFEDQYLSTAGMLYELATGKSRFVGDVRALVYDARVRAGRARGHDAHPYDLAAALVAREAGVLVTAVDRDALEFPLDTETPVRWAGFANAAIRAEVEAPLLELLKAAGLLPPPARAQRE
jgi:fructose-1,6-bisphosphatase/inositol monophosphatase family enzyme